MEKCSSGFVGVGGFCRPPPPAAAAATRRMIHSSELAYMEDLARKLAAFGLLDPNHHALSISKKQYCASPPPILPPPALGLSSPFQVFRPEEGKGRSVGCREVEGAFGFYGGGYGRVVVGRNVGVEQHPAGGGGGGGSGGRLRHAYPLGVAKRLPVISQVGGGCYGGPAPNSIPRRQIPGHAPVLPTKFVGSRRRCSGTGVFLPRVVNHDDSFNPGMKSRGFDVQRLQQEQQMELRAVAMGNQKGTSYSAHAHAPPAELVLPQEWTY